MTHEVIELEVPDLGEDSVDKYTIKGWHATGTAPALRKGYRIIRFQKPLPSVPPNNNDPLGWMAT